MRKQWWGWWLGAGLLALSGQALAGLSIIPLPQHVDGGQGSFRIDQRTGVDAPKDDRAQEIAQFMRDAVNAQTGIAMDRHGHGITLELDNSVHGNEAYRLSITGDGITIQAATDTGLFWGVQTLRQLLPEGHEPVAAVPALKIEDAPAYPWRGFMLDVSRHFYPVSFIEKQLDLLSYYKFNIFHWHLTDDQGWRLEVPRYKQLTRVGAWRTELDGSRYGGYYTEAEVREVVDYARKRNITVVPEIEMPGHSLALLASYPELSCLQQPLGVANTWGVFKDIDCVGNPKVFTFLENVLDEVIELFPSPYIHIGGDETPKDRWHNCASCQALMHAQGLKDEEGLQSYFIRTIEAYLESKGKTLVGWDEILEGGASTKAIVEEWRGDDEARKALANGNRIVRAGPFYFDTPTDRRTLRLVYQTDIAGPPNDAVFSAHRAQILGGEAALWSEHANPLNAESKLYPRLLALSEDLWTANVHDDAAYADFLRRLPAHLDRLDDWHVAYGQPNVPVVRYTVHPDAQQGGWVIRAQRGFNDLHTHYTVDGSTPTLQSPAFDDDVQILQPGTLKLVPYRGSTAYDEAQVIPLVDNLALGASIHFAQDASPPYASGDALVDGVRASVDYNDGRWAAWHDRDLQATIDLGKPRLFHHLETAFLLDPQSRILLPANVTFSISPDGEHWTQVYANTPSMDDSAPAQIRHFSFDVPGGLTTRYVRLQADRVTAMPADYVEGARDIWLFVDEVLVQ